ncbi:ankyrin repeat-containing domain protein [Fusarium flagelliforme]|uniref:ankyrin repeat-containing domain protein n=1 Tax=Fusarium flagelliforme TaxID=2675880 RepID=UPI001E8CBCDF|nr:ankyrin repeat-containing domain protein [Fusarium flagelliforme]KAH7192819.1 ankyrin repeat-containing domain protein [Fusarium flagelliforme]
MSLPYEACTANSEFIFKSRQDVDAHRQALDLIFEDPPALATTKDLILDRHPWISQYWSPRPELFDRDVTGLPPLAAAIKLGDIQEAQRLVNSGARADIHDPAFGNLAHVAVARSDHQIHEIFPLLKLVIEAGADPDAPGPEPEQESLLCFIIRDVFIPNYRHAICRYLVEEVGVDVNMRSQSGTYPIIIATELADRRLVHYLIQKGADVNVSDYQGKRAAHHAVPSASNRSIGLLIKAGVDLLPPDYYGRTPLHFAAMHCHWEFIGIFIDFLPEGYDINVKDDDGWTPLMYACKNARSDALKIEILVKAYGADVWPISYDGQWSALKLANFARMDAEALKCLEPPAHQRERTLEDGTKQVWDPDFHQTIPGEHHHYNSCSNCHSLTPRPLYICVDCTENFMLCFKCVRHSRRMHDHEHTMEEHVEPEMSEESSDDEPDI